jgi:hypothetical protein
LIDKYRNTWPDPQPVVDKSEPVLPPRTIPDSVLRFKLSASFDVGSSLFYSHVKFHPADFKVTLFVSPKDLNLSPYELKILIKMLGPRFNQGKQEIKLTSSRFPNRIENKRYLVLLLENLVSEAKRIATLEM